MHEWVKLFSLMNKNVPAQEARMIFLQCDVNNIGYLTMKELIPIVSQFIHDINYISLRQIYLVFMDYPIVSSYC